MLADAPMARPATTARMVAKATAETNANRTWPPTVPVPPPSTWASSGAALLPAWLLAAMSSGPTSAAAPKPSSVMRNRQLPWMPITHTADRRAVCASGTV